MRERIPNSTKNTMLMMAVFLWLLGFIPFVDWVTDPVQWAIFWLWFKMRNASLSKNWRINALSAVVTVIPTVGAILGAFPFVIYRNIRQVQTEDAEYNKSKAV